MAGFVVLTVAACALLLPTSTGLPQTLSGLTHPEDFSMMGPVSKPIQLHVGMTIVAHGHHNAASWSWALNLFTNCPRIFQAGCNCALHVNPRYANSNYKKQLTALNSMRNGRWERELQTANHFSLGPNTPFDLRVRVQPGGYEIYENRRYVGTLPHRFPIQQVTSIQISGNHHFDGVHWGGQKYPGTYAEAVPYGYLPFCGSMHLTARYLGKPFSINLQGDNDRTLFHFNPRPQQNAVVMNTMNADKTWMNNHETRNGIPFANGQIFDFAIFNTPQGLWIYINGNHYGTFAHRVAHPDSAYKRMVINAQQGIDMMCAEFA